jgi:hypothetical protein
MLQSISARTPRRLGFGARVMGAFGVLFMRPEPIEMVEQRFNFLPRTFRWRGGLCRVRSIVRVWDQRRSSLRPPRRYFEVICGQGGSYILTQDLRVGAWHMIGGA